MNERSAEDQLHSFDMVERVIANDMKFKARLGIGSDAFASIRIGKNVSNALDVGGAASTGAALASSPIVATTFFTNAGLLSSLGFGAAAATPIGWVVGAAMAFGGAYYGVTRLYAGYNGNRVDEIPRFLNSPVDLIGASMLDLLGALSIKLAGIDGRIDQSEYKTIRDYFIHDWGYDEKYVEKALTLIEENIDRSRLSEMTLALAEYARTNPDCNFKAIQKEVKLLLTEIAEADGILDEREEMAIEKIITSLEEQNSLGASVGRAANSAMSAANSTAAWIGSKLSFSRTSS